MFHYVGPYQGEQAGHAVSMEFGLFTTAFVLVLGGAAFLTATLTVERDRAVSDLHKTVSLLLMYVCYLNLFQAVERFTRNGTSQIQSSTSETEEQRQLLDDPEVTVKDPLAS